MTIKQKTEEIKKSKCCNAEINTRGGGYDDERICPIEDFCTKCGDILLINGSDILI